MYVQNIYVKYFSLLSKYFLALKTEIEAYVIDVVRKRRLAKGISQSELADAIDVSRGFIGDVENPRQRAKYNLNHINRIARILKCSPADLMPDDVIDYEE